MSELSPIILFVYNRPQHTRRTLASLEKNMLAQESVLYIYSDGAKTAEDIDKVNEVRKIIREPLNFKRIEIIERKKNYGLANNIIGAVNEIIEKHGKVIVLEDDLETSPFALQYFNDALTKYADTERVMQISGYMYPVNAQKALPESFLFRVANSWGWATWSRAWDQFHPDIEYLTKDFTKDKIKRFSVDGKENFWKQVKLYKAKKINSWAIRWYLSVFNNDGLVLYPRESMIQNIGTDGSGTHSDVDKAYRVSLATKPITQFPEEIEENTEAFEAIKTFYATRKGSLPRRAIRYLKKKLSIPSSIGTKV